MVLGCFVPAIHGPFGASVSYIHGADGQIFAVVATCALIAALCGWTAFASVGGWLGAIIAGVDFSNTVHGTASGVPVTIGEAWGLLFIGILMLIISAFMPRRKEATA